jgi:hypothetical protein
MTTAAVVTIVAVCFMLLILLVYALFKRKDVEAEVTSRFLSFKLRAKDP